jgi:hypothetical protein
MKESKHNTHGGDKRRRRMAAHDRPAATGAQPAAGDDRLDAARAALAAIDAAVFPDAKAIPFYEQSVLIRRAVIRLLADG